MSAFKFHKTPQAPVARKCIVCGTTKHEYKMKPFLLKGDQLNLWANSYFGTKRAKVCNFYAKLRYTINPYSCMEHFIISAKVFPTVAKQSKRSFVDAVGENEEPPSIEKITEKKPDPPPPDAPVNERSEKEIHDAVMSILQKAKAEMDSDEHRRKELLKISRKMIDTGPQSDFHAIIHPMMRIKKKKRKKREREEKVTDGNDADDSDDSSDTIDVEAIDSSESDEETTTDDSDTSSSGSGSEEEESEETTSVNQTPLPIPLPLPISMPVTPQPTPPRPTIVIMPRKREIASRPYKIADPASSSSSVADRSSIHAASLETAQAETRSANLAINNVPKRLTPSPAVPQQPYPRPSWMTSSTSTGGAQTLASVLQKFWNEDMLAPLNTGPPAPKIFDAAPPKAPLVNSTFGRHMLPGTTTKFMPASLLPPLKSNILPVSPSRDMMQPMSITTSTVRSILLPINNPPLSPSRLIVGSEETVETTTFSDEEKIELMSSSSSSSEESDVEVEVHSGERPPIVPEGQKIEGVMEPPMMEMDEYDEEEKEKDEEEEEKEKEKDDEEKEKDDTTTIGERSRSLSLGTTISSEDGEDVDVDVVTVEEEKKDEMAASSLAVPRQMMTPLLVDGSIPPVRNTTGYGLKLHKNRRKQNMTAYRTGGKKANSTKGQILYYHTASQNRRIILPPSATVKPPTKLLSTGQQFSMKELLHAHSRAAAVQPVRIDPRELLGLVHTFKRPRPRDMPRLVSEGSRKPQSEWARLERVIEAKMAEQKEQKEIEKRKKQQNLVDPRVMAENPPPVLEKVDIEEGEKTKKILMFTRMRADADLTMEHGFSVAIVDSLLDGKERQKSKVLRMRFHKKELDVSKLKVLDRARCPQGVGREETVRACSVEFEFPPHVNLRMREKRQKELKKLKGDDDILKNMLGPQVKNPQLVIVKKDIQALKSLNRQLLLHPLPSVLSMPADIPLNAPPPTPVVGLPDKEERTARRLMYEQKRHESLLAAAAKFGRVKMSKEEWKKKKMDELCGLGAKGTTDPFENKDEEALEMEVHEIVRKVKAAKRKMGDLEKMKEKGIAVLSDIEDEREDEGEQEKKDEEGPDLMSDDGDDEKDESGGVTRRHSRRLKMKRKMSKRASIWQTMFDEGAASSQDEELSVWPITGQKKRGRPRKYPAGMAPPKKKSKREEKEHMTAAEKEVLSRLLKTGENVEKEKEKNGDGEVVSGEKEVVNETEEEEQMEQEKNEETEKDDEEAPKLIEEKTLIDAVDCLPSKRKKKTWSWKERLDHDLTVNNKMGGRLCNLCMKHSKRYIWIANSAIALMDHARTHCVETLMCPNANCTYMNTQRSRISQHVSYVHKKWGMPIDLAELYPSMRANLMLRLRQSFPDMQNVAVCRICRVAVCPQHDLLRSHAQSHLERQVFQCSRDVCKLKFYSEQECLDHIKLTNCRGTIKNGMADPMDEEVSRLMEECFESVEAAAAARKFGLKRPVPAEESKEEDREVHSNTPSTSSKPSSQQEEKEVVEEVEEVIEEMEEETNEK